MKKLLQILPFILFTLTVNAQLNKDSIYTGKTKMFGNYSGNNISTTKPTKGHTIITGIVVKVDWCEEDCLTVWVKKDDGAMVAVGTKDYNFTVPKNITGKRIVIEGIESSKLAYEKKSVNKKYQEGIQFAATGVKIYY